MSKVTVFETVNEQAAGIDVGAKEIFVSVDGAEAVSFETFTSGYLQCIEYLQQRTVKRVAMEATGVYWMCLYTMLEDQGIKVCLVNPKETKQVKGRKTDVKDCRWIQKLFAAGLLRESYIPEGKYMELRQLIRERLDIIEMGSTYVNKMQKCLELMNIKLKEVISQIHGSSGIKILKAIIKGNREPACLLGLCDPRIIKNKSVQVLKSLEGKYNDTYMFMLAQNMQMWELHEQQVIETDHQIQVLLGQLCRGKEPVEINSKPKRIRHHEPKIKNLPGMLVQLQGVNLSSISGLNDYTVLRLIGETGTDMSRFPSAKHFESWCGLAPKSHQSGKMKKRIKGSSCNKAGQIFKECAQGLLNSKYIAIGCFMRKLRAKKDSAIAIKAGARKLAGAYYNGLTKGLDYVEQGVKKYEEQIKQKEIETLKRLAKKHNLKIAENQAAA